MEITSDVRFALRMFARRPGIPIVLAALFALGIGLASGMWAVIDAAVLRPLPYRDGRALVVVLEAHPQRGLMAVTPANFLDWATRVKSLQDVSGMYAIDVSVSPSTRGSEPGSSRSAPEQNPWPAPVMTTTRTSLS